MTCRVRVIGPDGNVTQARALLDSAASTSLITERLAQELKPPRRCNGLRLIVVAGVNIKPRGTVRFKVSGQSSGKQIDVEAFVLHKVTTELPTMPVSPVNKWRHLAGLDLADPDYATPARVDIILGGKVFSKAVLHGRGGLVHQMHHLHSRPALVGI